MEGFYLARIVTFTIEIIILTYVALRLAGFDTHPLASALIGDYSEHNFSYYE